MHRQTREFILRIIKYVFAGVFLFLCSHMEYIKRLVYPSLYAVPYNERLAVWDKDVFSDLSGERSSPFSKKYLDKKITFIPKKAYAVTARIGILERYEGWWEDFYHGHDESRKIYNAFAPIDIAFVHGEGAYHEKFDSCFGHEYRLLWSCHEINRDYFNNYHMIPATNKIKKGLETLIKGDIVYIKGRLVDVKVPDWSEDMHTGTSHNMTHENQFAGGMYTGMCFIIYLEELAVNGYLYK